MGNAKDAAVERRLRRKGENADENRRVGDGGRGGHRRVFGVVLLPKKLSQTGPGVSQFSFQERWDWTFLSLLSTQLRHGKNVRTVVLKVLFICLILQAGAIPGVLCEGFEPFERSVDEVASVASVGNCIISLWSVQTCF